MKSFSIGGIHAPENKLTADKATVTGALPSQAVVLLNQHLGAPAIPVVAKGETVKTGQIIAKASGMISACIHAPVSGKVLKIDECIDASGYKKPAIYIVREGDEWMEDIDRTDTFVDRFDWTPEQIREKIAAAGITGMGGAGFPTHVKLSPPPGKKAEVLIVNAVECEPYLTADHRLMLEKGREIVMGLRLLMKGVRVTRGIIAIENNKKDAIAYMKSLVSADMGIEVVALKVKYPQGGEKQLIDAAIGRQVPSGALPVDVGAIVQNVATVFAAYEAVQKNKPLIERIITVTGKTLSAPGNFWMRLGTSMQEVMDMAGGLPEDAGKIIGGGPMMGKPLVSLTVPMTKGSSGLLVLPNLEAPRKEIRNCIRCAKCVDACPMGLEPYLFMTLTQHEEWDKLEKERIMDCIECGCCTFSCPSTRPLLDYLRIGKQKVGGIIRARNQKKVG